MFPQAHKMQVIVILPWTKDATCFMGLKKGEGRLSKHIGLLHVQRAKSKSKRCRRAWDSDVMKALASIFLKVIESPRWKFPMRIKPRHSENIIHLTPLNPLSVRLFVRPFVRQNHLWAQRALQASAGARKKLGAELSSTYIFAYREVLLYITRHY